MSNQTEVKIKDVVMNKVLSGKVKMKPRWYFVAGSVLSFAGLVGLIVGAVFLTNLTIFLVRKQGPGTGKILSMLESFPLWIPFLALVFVVVGIVLLKKYDFSYKNNFGLIVAVLIIAIILSTKLIDYLGFDKIWEKRGPRFLNNSFNQFHQSPRKYQKL